MTHLDTQHITRSLLVCVCTYFQSVCVCLSLSLSLSSSLSLCMRMFDCGRWPRLLLQEWLWNVFDFVLVVLVLVETLGVQTSLTMQKASATFNLPFEEWCDCFVSSRSDWVLQHHVPARSAPIQASEGVQDLPHTPILYGAALDDGVRCWIPHERDLVPSPQENPLACGAQCIMAWR